MKRLLIILFLITTIAPAMAQNDIGKRYTWENLNKRPVPAWFDDAKFGIMIHWGPYSVIGHRKADDYAEWAPYHMYRDGQEVFNSFFDKTFGAHPPEFGYKDVIPLFKAEKWNPDEWADLFEKAGARYVTLTAEHHDGYALWDSDLTDWCATKIGPKRDLVGDLGKALRGKGIRYAPSYHRERHNSFFAAEMYTANSQPLPLIAKEIEQMPEAADLYGPFNLSDAFIDDYVARWKEIQDKYKPDFMWVDDVPIFYWTEESKNHPQTQKFRDAFLNMIGDYFAASDEWGKEVYLNNKGKNLNWPDGPGCLEMDNLRMDDISIKKWENPATLGSSYGYARDEDEKDAYKSPTELIHLLCDVVSKNGNLLLNIGPRADGTIPEGMVKRLLAIGEWLDANGEAIYDTRPWLSFKQDSPDIRFTQKPDALYAILMEKPTGPFVINLDNPLDASKVSKISILGLDTKIEWRTEGKQLLINPPKEIKGEHAWVFKLFKGPKGVRPYELDWAGRITDDHIPLIDFENLEGWKVQSLGGSSELSLSEEQKIWGKYTCKIAYNGDAKGAELTISPPEPVKISDPFTAVNLWVWNDYWKWEDDKGQPLANMSILLETPNGEDFDIPFCRELDWPGWYLLHIRLNSLERDAFKNGGFLKGFRMGNCIREIRDSVYLDNLSFYVEDYSTPLEYDILPRPGIDLAPGQDLGVHTGEERLPFPTREETILPVNIEKNFSTEVLKKGEAYVFRYQGLDGTLEYRYKPQDGNLSDVSAQWMDNYSTEFLPMDGGGIELKLNDNVDGIIQERFGGYITKEKLTEKPDKAKLLDCKIVGEKVVAHWKVSRGAQSVLLEYVFQLKQKSLVTDIHCEGGEVGKVSFGKVSNADNPRPMKVPFLVGRPGILQMGTAIEPLFMSSVVDHYRTGSSRLFFENKIKEDGVYSGGGTHYIPKMNGERNDCHERFFLTISPRFEEVLPEIPNPKSRWRDVAADYLVCYYAVDDRDADYRYWENIARYGMNKVIMLDWETAWRDGSESFTFRTSAAPGKGGDENLREYVRKVQELGFRCALYNNYVDYAPVNAWWDEDMVTRMPTGGWQQGWFRTYSPKPAKVVNISRGISAINQDKFNPKAAGPDVHTAVSPWSRVDFDPRMPGAGTMIQQYYSYGQLLYEQQQIWNGPVYSECDNNYYYSGLTTGSGACEHGYNFETEPWLVDFYIRKMQPISCHWALGLGERTDKGVDRFIARTIAFAQPGGFLGGWKQEFDHFMIRGYFMTQQLQSSYCKALIKDIQYADKNGDLLDVSRAIATGEINRSQIKLVYDNGLIIWVNGHNEDNWSVAGADLPPSGYYAHNPNEGLTVSSSIHNEKRVDWVQSVDYDYVDGRGDWFESPKAASDGKLIILKNESGFLELIPHNSEKFALALKDEPKSIIALDKNRNEIGTGRGKFQDGYFHIEPVQGAFSYMIQL